ncbi:MAG: NnrS family protein [Acidobacteriota bacterium]
MNESKQHKNEEIIINKHMTLPEIILKFPQTREIFDRYGLKGCGGPLGPPETVEFFSKVHKVDEKALLEELNEAVKSKPKSIDALLYKETLGDILYKRFFKAAIVIVLTIGCLFGAINLAYISLKGSFFALPLKYTIAHAHAMVAGWVALFIMGFAYQAFPRFAYSTLWNARLASLTFYLMISGIILYFPAQLLNPSTFTISLGIFSGFLETAAIFLFILIIVKTIKKSGKKVEAHGKFVFASFFFFLVQSIFNIGYFYSISSAKSFDSLVEKVSILSGPLRDIQLIGFAGMMIFGVSQRLLPTAFGFNEISKKLSNILFAMMILFIVSEIIFLYLLRSTKNHIFGIGVEISYPIFFVCSLTLFFKFGILKKISEKDRSLKFIRASYSWLVVSVLMLLLFPFYNSLTNQSFSHAFWGSYRHAFTVGFITMMIMGVSSKIIPMLSGKDVLSLNSLMIPFVLINAGNILRITSETLTDFIPKTAFSIMGFSGFIEVIALFLWGYEMYKNMTPSVVSLKYLSLF